jgi:hypothetical protein
MNYFLDDQRNPNDAYLHLDGSQSTISLVEHTGIHQDDWVIMRTYDEFVKCVTHLGLPDVVSFDHDLHEEHIKHYFMVTQDIGVIEYGNLKEKTGKHCAEYLVQEWKKQNKPKHIKTFVHSANQWGQINIKEVLKELR